MISSILMCQVDAQSLDEDSEIFELDAVTVSGFRSSLASSLNDKKHASQVIDAINSEEIGQFPDQNIAEAIQRISGVSITRNNGEGESVTIRGLSPTFTRVEIDGRSASVTVDSANPERQSVLSTFASDLYSSIEVVKSPTAADVEGGIGGIVRLSTPDPLTVGSRKAGLNVSLTDADLRDSSEFAAGGFWTNTFAEGRLGVLFSGTYQERDRRIDKIQSNQDWVEVEDGDLAGARYPGRVRLESRTGEAPKLNLNAKVQFMATEDLELYLNGLFTSEERDEDRARLQTEFKRGKLQNGEVDPETGTLVSGEFTKARTDYRTFNRIADIETSGLTGGLKWRGDAWKAHFEVSDSSSEEDFTETRADVRVAKDGVGGYDIAGNPRYPLIYTESINADLEDLSLRSLNLQKRIIGIDEGHVKLDLERNVKFGAFDSVKFGARDASSEFSRRQGQIEGQTKKSNGDDITYADGSAPYVLRGDFGFGQAGDGFLVDWPAVDPVGLYEMYPSTQAFAFNDENLWDFSEDSLALYLMGEFRGYLGEMTARGNVGIRHVNTKYNGKGRLNIQTADDEFLLDDEPAIERSYDKVLPAFNLVLDPGKSSNFQVRGAITRAMTRPTINEIQPGVEVNTEDADIVRGNPDLDPFLAWQYDLGLEYYFGESEEGLFSGALFKKDVENFIVGDEFAETVAFSQVGIPAQEYLVSTFRNGGEAKVQGFELNFQTPLDFISDGLSNFGTALNYTYTDSEFTDANGNEFTFPGASENTFNAILYYENERFSARAAYNYRDAYLIQTSSNSDGSNAVYGDGQGRLDLAFRYRLESGVRFSFDILNLTEEQNYLYYDTPQRLEDLEFEGTIYSLSVAYVF